MPPPASTPFDPDSLLAHAQFVRALSRALVRDEGAAEDLAARTMATALSQRPGTGPGFRGWLRRVLQRLLRRDRIAAERRAERERASAPGEATPPTVDLVAQIELERRVTTAFAALDEPYRSTLFLRFFHGRAPREIAFEQHVPVATVKTRLKRGLDQLRRELDRLHHGRRESWRAPALALWSTGGAAVVTMKAKVAMAAAVVVFVGGVATWIEANRGASTRSAIANDSRASGPTAAASNSRSRDREEPSSSDADRDAATAASRVAELPFASGIVADERGAPVADAAVVAGRIVGSARTGFSRAPLDHSQLDHEILARSGIDGRFAVSATRSDLVALDFVKDGFAVAEWSELSPLPDENQDHRIVLTKGHRITGRIHDPEGRPIAIARASVNPNPNVTARFTARSVPGAPAYVAFQKWETQRINVDEAGRFEFSSIPDEHYRLWCTASGYRFVILNSGELFEPPDVTLHRGGIFLDVKDAASGARIDDARAIVARADTGELGVTVASWVEELGPQLGEVERTEPGRVIVWQETLRAAFGNDDSRSIALRLRVIAPNHRAKDVRLDFSGDTEPPQLDVALEPGRDAPALAGRVTGAEHVEVAVRFVPWTSNANAQNEPALEKCEVGEDGRFEFLGLLPGEYRVDFRARGMTPRWLDVRAPSFDVRVELAPAARIDALVVDSAGTPQAGIPVHVQSEDGSRAWSGCSDATGHASVDELPDGKLVVAAAPGLIEWAKSADSRIMTLDRRDLNLGNAVVLEPGERREVTLVIPQQVSVVLRARHPDGSAAVGVKARLENIAHRTGTRADAERLRGTERTTDSNGEARFDGPSGSWWFEIALDGPMPLQRRLDIETARGGESAHEILVPDLAALPTCEIRGRVVDLATARPLSGIVVCFAVSGHPESMGFTRALTDSDGHYCFAHAPATDVRIIVYGDGNLDGSINRDSPYVTASRTLQIDSQAEVVANFALPKDNSVPEGQPTIDVDVTVVDRDTGVAVADAYVSVGAYRDGALYHQASPRTDASGRVTTKTLAGERYWLSVHGPYDPRVPGARRYADQQFELSAEDGVLRLRVELQLAEK